MGSKESKESSSEKSADAPANAGLMGAIANHKLQFDWSRIGFKEVRGRVAALGDVGVSLTVCVRAAQIALTLVMILILLYAFLVRPLLV